MAETRQCLSVTSVWVNGGAKVCPVKGTEQAGKQENEKQQNKACKERYIMKDFGPKPPYRNSKGIK